MVQNLNHLQKFEWKKYLFEFVLIFFAVFFGLVTDSIRQDFENKKNEKEFIKSLINNIKIDKRRMNKFIQNYRRDIKHLDTICGAILYPSEQSLQMMVRNIDSIGNYNEFFYSDNCIQQLKSAGGFKIIGNQKVIDSIFTYDEYMRLALTEQEVFSEREKNVSDFFFSEIDFSRDIDGKLSDNEYLKKELESILSMDSKKKKRLSNLMLLYHYSYKKYGESLEKANRYSDKLINFFKTEYEF